MILPMMGAADVRRLREALTSADYTTHGLTERISAGVTERCGLIHRDTAKRAATGDDSLSVLIRLFLGATAERWESVAHALSPLDPAAAVACGLLVETPEGLQAGMQLHPYRDWWILADLSPHWTGNGMKPDHVLCAGPASVKLVAALMRDRVDTALDLGTGSGVQALHLSGHANRVTATDLSPRALRFAATTAALNGLEWELLEGDLTAPVAGRRFDLVVSNPPYVLSPGGTDFLYRDSGRPGDAISAELVGAAKDLLTEGGYLQTMASWAHVHGEDWTERVAAWIPAGMDAWVVQTALTDAKAYVDHWAGETAAEDARQKAAWLEWFTTRKIQSVGTGLVTLRNSGADQPVIRLETLYQPMDSPLGGHIRDWFGRMDWLASKDLLNGVFTTPDGLQLRQTAYRDPAGWELRQQTMTMLSGLCWQENVDQLMVSVVGNCHGDRPLREVLHELAELEGADVSEVLTVARKRLPILVERGFLVPVGPPA